MTQPDCHTYPGGRVGRDDPRYETLVRGFNLRWVGRPSSIALCGDAEQVRQTVQDAVDHDLRLTVRSGGHCYENFAVHNENGILVDMAPMNRVYYDSDRSEEHTSELQSLAYLVCRLLLEKKKKNKKQTKTRHKM